MAPLSKLDLIAILVAAKNSKEYALNSKVVRAHVKGLSSRTTSFVMCQSCIITFRSKYKKIMYGCIGEMARCRSLP